jgi:3-oxoacyl-[acyl-carrier protein] reductase
MVDLSGKVALVTGAGRGIGRAIALKLAGEGATVAVNDIGDTAKAVVAEIEALKRSGLAVLADVSDAAAVNKMVETVVGEYGRLDILVNNAGISRDQIIMRMSDEDWDSVINIDLKSAFLCSRAVMRPMLKQRWGRIISISSVVGVMGNKGQANYAAAKAGIIGLTRSIAKEVASRGITANAIAPGYIDTEMTQGLNEEWREQLKGLIPLGYLGTPEDVAETVAFLGSEAARYITGQVLGVDGGLAVSWL